MSYCNQDDIQAEINSQDLIPFLDDENTGALNTTRLNQIIDLMSAKIDGRISSIYSTPLTPTPPALRDSCTILVCEALYKRRLVPDERNPFHAEAEAVRERLLMIGNGKLELDKNFPRNFFQGVYVASPIAMDANSM